MLEAYLLLLALLPGRPIPVNEFCIAIEVQLCKLSETKVKTHHLFPQLPVILDKCLLMILASTAKLAS